MNIAKVGHLLKKREIRLELKREDHAQVQIRLGFVRVTYIGCKAF